MQVVEGRLNRPLEDVLRELYLDQGKTVAEVGLELGVDGSTITRWMARLGIEARFPGQRAKVDAA